MRPLNLDDYIGQQHLIGEGKPLRNAIESGAIPSMILWGPPGVGKTTLAQIISQKLKRSFYTLSAINSGVKDIREVIEKVKVKACLAVGVLCCSLTRFTGLANRNKTHY